jgi:hypothetical protein
MLELGPRGRGWLCALFFGGELVLVATAGLRTDRSYGFRMFPEASSIRVHLDRRLDGGHVVPIQAGAWQAHDCSGDVHRFVWRQMVHWPAPAALDALVGAPYGVDNEVQRTHDAMRWVSDHTPDDCETRALVAHVERTRNGQPLDPLDLEIERAR